MLLLLDSASLCGRRDRQQLINGRTTSSEERFFAAIWGPSLGHESSDILSLLLRLVTSARARLLLIRECMARPYAPPTDQGEVST